MKKQIRGILMGMGEGSTMMRLIHPRQSTKQFKMLLREAQQIPLLISMQTKRMIQMHQTLKTGAQDSIWTYT
jgi:hypothetical protein